MAHEIDFSTGQAAIAYTGEVPWHGYGQAVEEDLPLEAWRTLAGLDFEVQERMVEYTKDPEINPFLKVTYPKKKVLIRSDNKQPLSVVSDRYKVVQPKEVIDFFESVIKENGFKMSTAGALRDGKRVWAMADCGKDFVLPGGDQVGAHLLLATSYDGTFATTAQFCATRVVCQNTLNWTLKQEEGAATSIKIPHNVELDKNYIKKQLGLFTDGGWTQFQDNVIRLTDVKVTKRQAVEFFLELLGVTEEEVVKGKQLANTKKLLAFYESSPGSDLVTAKDTTWGLVNAVSYWTDHARRSRDNGTRWDSAAFGEGNRIKQRAFASALQLADAA